MENLLSRARAAGIELNEAQAARLTRYHELLMQANQRMNLTRVPADPQEAIDRNYLDSLAPLRFGALRGVCTLIDVGAGAGLPGIPLSIALPDVRVTLLDALGKRVKFLNEVIAELGLNAVALHARAEDAAHDPALRGTFDVVVARAVAPLNVLCELALPFLRVGGRLIAYKGPALNEELVQANFALRTLGGCAGESISTPIPGRDWDHRLQIIEKIRETPAAYPRKAGEPNRKPLGAAKL